MYGWREPVAAPQLAAGICTGKTYGRTTNGSSCMDWQVTARVVDMGKREGRKSKKWALRKGQREGVLPVWDWANARVAYLQFDSRGFGGPGFFLQLDSPGFAGPGLCGICFGFPYFCQAGGVRHLLQAPAVLPCSFARPGVYGMHDWL